MGPAWRRLLFDSRTHCQGGAGARVGGLTPLFEGWVKPVHLKQGSQYSPGARW